MKRKRKPFCRTGTNNNARLTLRIVQYRLLLPDVRTLLQFMRKKAKHENHYNKFISYFELLYMTFNYRFQIKQTIIQVPAATAILRTSHNFTSRWAEKSHTSKFLFLKYEQAMEKRILLKMVLYM